MFTAGEIDQVFKQKDMDEGSVPMAYEVAMIVAAAHRAGVLPVHTAALELYGDDGVGLSGWRIETIRDGGRLRLLSAEATPLEHLRPLGDTESMRDYVLRVLVWAHREGQAIDRALVEYTRARNT